MRNANIDDVKRAVAMGMLEENVMYSMNGLRVHGKKTGYMVSHYMLQRGEALVECAGGVLYKALIAAHIQPVVNGESQKPKRIKRKPVKGTRPEKLIPMSADVKLKVGDKVVLADGSRGTVLKADRTEVPYFVESRGWFDTCGEYLLGGERITHKIIPYAEWALPQEPVLAAQKSPEQEAFEKGHWVAFIADAQTRVPPFATGWKVDYLMRDMQSYRAEYAENLRWNAKGNNADIVAYRKAPKQ